MSNIKFFRTLSKSVAARDAEQLERAKPFLLKSFEEA
tara:strand:- start:391 stop:501 length:111 start_codon:yes stop_codon:yes gene_type:complete